MRILGEFKEEIGSMNFFKSKCYQGGERHKFVPFYEITKPSMPKFGGSLYQYEYLLNLRTQRIYQFHICEWCGKKIKEE